MKIFTKKFFLLAIGMILSVGASAQGDGIKHRFPQVNYTMVSSGKTIEAFVPAWDINMYNDQYPGCLRLQITEVIHEDLANKKNSEYNCKIVYRLGILSDLSDFNQTSNSTSISFTDKSGTIVTKKAGEVQYSDYIDIDTYDTGTWFEGTDYDHADYQVFNYKTSGRHYVYGEYVIPETYECGYGKFHITDIDMFAFRNNTVDKNNPALYWFRPTSFTIPATINSIGYGAFLNNTSTTTITFDSESPIKEIPPRTFMNCAALKTVTLPASVEKIWGASFGGCTNLEKIIFTGEEAPELKDYTHTNLQNYNFITATSATFPGLTAAKCIMEVPLHSAKKYAEKDDLYKQFPMMSKFTLNKDIVTYCSDLPFTFKQYNTSDGTWSDGGVDVYYVAPNGVNVEGRRIEFTKIDDTIKIPSETGDTPTGYFGVLLKGTAGETYDIFYPNNVLTDVVSAVNCLGGVIEETPITVNNDLYLYYVLSNGSFLPVTKSGKLAANKAFIKIEPKVNMPVNARELALYFPGETTGISNYDVQSSQNDAFYTLQGIRVKNPEKGVFIKNGKKIIIK